MLIFSMLFILLANAVTLRRDKSILFSRITITVLIISTIISIDSLYISYLSTGISLYGGLFHVTSTTHIFHIFLLLVTIVITQLTGFYPRRVVNPDILKNVISNTSVVFNEKIINKKGEQFNIIEYPLIILFVIIGAMFLVSTSDLVSIFLAIELQSYGLYIISTLYRNSELSTSGGLTYFLLGGLSSCFILLGASLLYANSGTTSLDGIYIISNISIGNDSNDLLSFYKPDYINLSLLVLSVGFLFKVSAAPFHFWSPGVYDAIPTIVTTFVAIIPKISIFIFLLELVHYTTNSYFVSQFDWVTGLLLSSLLSLIVGTVGGLTQFRIKRLYTYSTISHVGFILLAIGLNTVESIQAFIFYLMQYSISNLNAFFLLISIGYSLYIYTNENKSYNGLIDKNNSPVQLVDQLKGYFFINPVLALSFTITIFSFVGIPPLIGFFAKQIVLSAALDSGYVFITLVAILTSVISAVYYLNLVKQIFFDKPEYKLDPSTKTMDIYGNLMSNSDNVIISKVKYKFNNIILSSYLTITVSILTLIILLFIFTPQEWLSMANILALYIYNP